MGVYVCVPFLMASFFEGGESFVCLFPFLKRKKEEGVGWLRRWRDLGGVGGEKSMIRVYCIQNLQ